MKVAYAYFLSVLKRTAATLPLVFVISFSAIAQVPFYEGFEQAGPYPAYNLPFGWKQSTIIGNSSSNKFSRLVVGLFPSGVPPHSGSAMVRYESFNTAGGESAFICSKPLDLTNRGAVSSNFRFWMYRDAGFTPPGFGPPNDFYDSIRVYINTIPAFSGPNLTLLSDTANGMTRITRHYSQPPVVAAVGWYRYGYTIPAGAPWSTTKTYVLIVGYSRFGNDIHIDDFSTTIYPTNQVFQSTDMVFQNTACIAPGTSAPASNNWIVGIRIVVDGAGTPYGLDSINFNTNGSTNPCIDIVQPGAKLWWTGGTRTLDMTIAQQVGVTVGTCSTNFKFVPSPVFRLDNDTNYFWLTYDVATMPPATNGCLDAEYLSVKLGFGSSGNTTKFPTIGTLPGCREIGSCPCIPVLSYGTSTGNFINQVTMVGDPGYPPGINNLSGPYPDPDYYASFPPVSGMTATLQADNFTSYTLIAQSGTAPSGNYIAAWIDFNHDYDFFDAGEHLGQSSGLAGTALWNLSFTVPLNAVIGTTTLRIRETNNNNISACGFYLYGETEDYSVTIIPCTSSPSASITPAGPTTFCLGSNVILNANTATGLTYQWKKNGVNIIGGTSSAYTATSSGNYTVQVTNTCGSSVSSPVIVTVNSLPLATVTAAGPVTFCQGGSVVLNANTGINLAYQWKKNGNNISGGTSSNYTATSSGTYNIVVTNTVTGCTKTSHSFVVVTVNPKPPATITPPGTIIFCAGQSALLTANSGAGYTYKWKKNGNYISGATAITYTVTTAGNYKVEVTNGNGCSKTSIADTVLVPCRTGENNNVKAFDAIIYPNPSVTGRFTIQLINKPSATVSFEITDVIGKVVDRFQVNDELIVIDKSNLAAGIYYLSAKNKDAMLVKKIVIQ